MIQPKPIIMTLIFHINSSSSSFELFVVSIMQENVHIGHTALALTCGWQVFSETGATTMDTPRGSTICLPHKDEGISLSFLPKDTTRKLAGLFSTLSLSVKQKSCEYHFLKSFGMIRLGK